MLRVYTTVFTVLISLLVLNACTGQIAPSSKKNTKEQVQAAITSEYRIERGKQIVELKVNGQGPYAFVLDTGSGGMVVGPAFKELLNLPIVGTEMASSPASDKQFEVQQVNLASIDLGGAKSMNVKAPVLDMVPEGIMGVIGPIVFKEYGRFAIDFTEAKIVIGGSMNAWPNKTWIPFGKGAPLLDVELQIGNLSIPAHIDSGGPSTITLPEKYTDKLALTGPTKVIAKARMVDRELEIKEAPIDLVIEFGDASITLNRVLLFDFPYANIGLEGLKGLYLEIDWVNQRFAVQGSTIQSAP